MLSVELVSRREREEKVNEDLNFSVLASFSQRLSEMFLKVREKERKCDVGKKLNWTRQKC